jgi:glycine/D-amino acid oxidase-like deaminating enzyme/nitrite reductase/ring-hydroxylating ferredoxin subunit
LRADARADVCVVGAGIAGACVAHELARQGRSVVVLDDGPVAGGETGRSTAHVTCALDDRYYALERLHGTATARLAALSHTAAIDWFERRAREIEFGFARLDGYLTVPEQHRGTAAELLDRERAAALRAGVAVEWVDRTPWPGWGPALRFPRQGELDPVAAARGLLEAARRAGARLCLGSHVVEVHGGAEARAVTADNATVWAGHIVVATNTPINNRVVIHTKQASYRTYAIAATLALPLEPILLWDGYWESDRSYHYVRLATLAGLPHLIVGGEDHKTGQEDHERPDHFELLEAWARERVPELGEVTHRWSGQVLEPVDGLGFIGRNPMDSPNVYLVTGDSGNGITHSAIAGMLIPDLIAGRESPWEAVYSPGRKPLSSLGRFVRENVNAAARYGDWLNGGEAEDQIPRGCGAVVSRGLHKLAVYRDDHGVVTRCSATCPHLGGVVRWNPVERTWDCPVHGSRFDATGHVINGPANTDLRPAAGPGAPAPEGLEAAPGA